jgi:hypothetical protein
MIATDQVDQVENNSIKVEYQLFDDLILYEEHEDFEMIKLEIIKMINDESNWINQYEALNNLRRLNKFCPLVFNSILQSVILQISKLTSSIRSNLSKLSIMLVREVFMSQNLSSNNLKYIKNLITCTLTQSVSMKAFIREESLAALENLSNNYYFFSSNTLHVLIEEVGHKNLSHSENSFNIIIKIVENWSKEDIFSGTNYSQWEGIYKQILNLYSMKREPFSKRACRIIEAIHMKFGEEDFQNILNSLNLDNVNKNNLLSMIKSVQNTKNKSKQVGSIKEMISKNKFSK